MEMLNLSSNDSYDSSSFISGLKAELIVFISCMSTLCHKGAIILGQS